ncbi:MAG: hypothetical protein IPH53_08525 [Flavobacteriales bacterium]|nr:hypothetical protein [Flavobacteriales bacterium]
MSRILSTVLLGLSLSNGRAQDLALATSGDKALEETHTKGNRPIGAVRTRRPSPCSAMC